MNKNKIKTLVFSGLCLCLGLLLPQIFGRIQTLGQTFLPMHYPVLICGFLCGAYYGGAVGFLTPILCSLVFSMPPLYPTALAMAFELLGYGLCTGLLFKLLNKKLPLILSTYISLISSMIFGRLIYGLTLAIIYGLNLGVSANQSYTFKMFITGTVLNGLPGIIAIIIIIPVIVFTLVKAGLIKKAK